MIAFRAVSVARFRSGFGEAVWACRVSRFLLISLAWAWQGCLVSWEAKDAVAQGPQLELVEWGGQTMGPIRYKVIVAARRGEQLDELKVRVAETLERINSRMSTYRPDSEVTRFNQQQTTDWFVVSDETARVVIRAQELSRDSSGAFDITVKPLVELWNFGAGREAFRIPEEDAIAAAKEVIGWQKLQVRLEPPGLSKLEPRLQIDLSAIAKGYAVDAVAGDLQAAGLENWFVEVGGEASASGAKPDGSPWRVGIERPQAIGQSVQRVVELRGQAIATSGDYRNFAIVDGQRYSHEIDPATGWPVRNEIASASILASDCMTADGLATAVMILGPERSKDLLAKYQAEAYYLRRNADRFEEIVSPGFPVLPQEQAESGPFSTLLPVFLATLGLFLLAVGGLLVGVLVGNKPLRGSCGGLSAATGQSGSCGVCGGEPADCQQADEQGGRAD